MQAAAEERLLETNLLLVQILVTPSRWFKGTPGSLNLKDLWTPFTISLFSLNEAGDAVETRSSLQYIEQKRHARTKNIVLL